VPNYGNAAPDKAYSLQLVNSTLQLVVGDLSPGTNYPVAQHFGTFTGSGNAIGIVDAPYNKFLRLLRLSDGSEVDPGNYTVVSGSTVVTLSEAYLQTFPNGTHLLRAVFTDGYADLTLQVNNSTGTGIPQTGDAHALPATIAALCFALGVAVMVVGARRRQHSSSF
jgi:LPXTG-motif cell wall-anchored protein